MCGIAGYFSKHEKSDGKEILQRMADSLIHRGPDAEGYYLNRNCGLAHRRLKIIDLSDAANQPMIDEQTKNTLTFNGEIYNYQQLKFKLQKQGQVFTTESDTEVLLRGLTVYGEQFIDELEGDFAFAFWHHESNELLLGRDRFGVKPLYIHVTDDTTWFASEIKSLLSIPIKAEINKSEITNYFRYRYVPSNKTLFANIEQFPPGHSLRIKNGQHQWRRYYTLGSPEDGTKDFALAFSGSVLGRLNSDNRVGLFLSAGIDSGAIAFQIASEIKKVSTFSYSFNLENDALDESAKARNVAQSLGFENQTVFHEKENFKNYPAIIRTLEEPIGDSVIIANDLLFKSAKKSVDVALSGEGADELFSSYAHHRVFGLISNLKKYHLQSIAAFAVRLIPLSILNNFSYYPVKLNSELKSRLLNSLNAKTEHEVFRNFSALFNEAELQSLLGRSYTEDQSFFEKSIQVTDYKNWLPKYGLLRLDKIAMAHSLEVRSPYLSHHLIAAIWNTKWTEASIWKKDKFYFRKFCRQHLKITSQEKKQPFFGDTEKIFSDGYPSYVKDVLAKERLNKYGILNFDFVNGLLIQNRPDFQTSKKITSILIFQIWCEQFF